MFAASSRTYFTHVRPVARGRTWESMCHKWIREPGLVLVGLLVYFGVRA